MFQRIQTLFLIVVFAACTACFFFPFWNYVSVSPEFTYQVSLFSIKYISGNPQIIMVGTLPILVLASVSAILALVALFSFKNREMQIKMNSYNIFITVIFIVTIYLYLPYNIQKALPVADYQWQYGLVFPLISLAFLILANVFIKKDEKLVKSADRLR